MSWGAIAGAVIGGVVASTSSKSSSKAAVSAQKDQNQRSEEFIREQAEAARKDILPLFGAAQQNRQLGAQQALDIFGEALPQQAGLFREGNVRAQQALLAGLPQFQNAILGLPTDTSFLQPRQLSTDFSFAQQQLPQFQTSQQALAPPPPFEGPNIGVDPGNLLGGGALQLGRGAGVQKFFGQGGGRFANRTIRGV